MKKKVVCLGIIAMMMFGTLTGCEVIEDTSDKESNYTEMVKQQSLDMVGLPDVSNFFEMSQLKEIYEMRDDPNLICYWYTKNQMTGKWVYEGTCIGYGIPYGASITNPEFREYGTSSVTLPQAEPNGLYTNTVTSSATWVLTTDADGNIEPTYVEQEISVRPTKIDAGKCETWSLPDNY